MNGDFCLVYSIHEEVYRLVEAKETKTNFDTPISLFIDCYRSGIHFEFTLEDVQNVDSIF